jgi:hypothetical protein
MDWDDDINDLFERFVEEVNDVPFNTEYENTPEFRLNQSIINNTYLLRRTIEMYPDELRNILGHQRVRRSPRIQARTQSQRNHIISHQLPRAPILTRFSDDEMSSINSPYIQRYNNGYDTIQSPIWTSLDLQFTDSIFESLFTNFNQFITENLNDLEDVKVTLSPDEFNNLEKVTDEMLIENKQCNICLEDLKKEELDNKSLIQLQCSHIYHNICIQEWLTKQSTKCPSCRFCCRTQTSTNSE